MPGSYEDPIISHERDLLDRIATLEAELKRLARLEACAKAYLQAFDAARYEEAHETCEALREALEGPPP